MLCSYCRDFATHFVARGKSHVFYQVSGGTWGIFSNYNRDEPSNLVFVQRQQDSCLVMRATSGISTRLGRAIWMLVEVRREMESPFLVGTGIYKFLSIFKKSQASSPFEALNSTFLSWCQRDVRPPVQMTRGPMDFSRLSTVDTVIPSSCEKEEDPAFQPLQGNPAFFLVRALGAHST